jgi:soluble lytic murein transglycosylase
MSICLESNMFDRTWIRRLATLGVVVLATTAGARADEATLRQALTLADKGNLAGVEALRGRMSALENKLADWTMIRLGLPEIPSQAITRFAIANPTWPDPESLRRRAEQALERENPGPDVVIRAFAGSKAYSNRGQMLLARALVATGRTKDAQAEIQRTFRDPRLTDTDETALLSEFGSLLTAADYKARMDYYLLKSDGRHALRIAEHLGPAYQQLAKARLAVERNDRNAGQLLDSLPSSIKSEPAYIFGRAQWERRNKNFVAAGQILAAAPKDPRQMGLPDEWWEEKRLVSRELLDLGQAKLAYRIVADHHGSTPAPQAEADFHAGWYALRFLGDARAAAKHFADVAEDSVMPVTRARAYYWLGRAAEAGSGGNARAFYTQAAEYGFTFYGQMARAKLSVGDLGLGRNPAPTAADKAAAQRDDRFAALDLLTRLGRREHANLFYRHLAETLPTAGQIAILINHAEHNGGAYMAVNAGKMALRRGLDMQALAFPTSGAPSNLDTAGLERALAFAIMRQESEFNMSIVSSAGATGIFQVMPDTGRDAAKYLGIAYNKSAWKNDPAYNIRLGAAYVNRLVENYDGNYVMAIAGYNAGPGRIRDWVQRYGDPRDPQIDIVDWMERIPFSETRNYVHRVLENLQVYRYRLDGKGLQIVQDLRRGVGARGAVAAGGQAKQAMN